MYILKQTAENQAHGRERNTRATTRALSPKQHTTEEL